MFYCDRIDLSKGIDGTKSIDSKACIVCHYWYFNHKFKFQKSVCNGCHDLLMISPNIKIFLSSPLKVLIIFVLFLILAKLMRSIW